MSLLIIVSSFVSILHIQSSEAKDDQFCNEWAKYIDALDMVSAGKQELPYSMNKNTGDLIK